MISIICACNNISLYNEMLKESIENQNYSDYEIILIDTNKQKFSSAAEALNYGAKKSKGDILMFCHQDISFSDKNFFDKLVDLCDKNDFGIAGVAGAKLDGKKILSSVRMGKDHEYAGEHNEKIIEVDSLDECLFIIKRNKFVEFKDYNCWHFYAVEYSLRCKERGESVLLLPLEIYHLSPGWSLNESYWVALKKVAKDHKNYKIIPTTISFFHNGWILNVGIALRKLKRKVLKRRYM